MNQTDKPINVLLVDDDELDRRLVKLVLVKAASMVRFNVESAQNMTEAIEKLAGASFNIILLDLNLPDSRGTETVQKIFEVAPDVSIVVLTGLDDEDAGLDAIRSGAEDYLVKGDGLEYTLIRTIRYAIERKKAKASLIDTKHELERINARLMKATATANQLASEADKANTAKSQFLANMSHEIRTPMNAIIGFSEVLDEENLTAQQSQYVKLILDSGKHLLELINDILDFSKIEAGQMETESVDCDIRALVENVNSLMKPSITNKQLDLLIECSDEVPQVLVTDPARLRQCLINLVSNAIKFTDTGYVKLQVGKISRNNEPFVEFTVLDTGVGIPSDKLVTIFDSFTQADGSTTRKYGGTGLGLAITKQLAVLMGGDVDVTSEVGKGSAFKIIIPVVKKENDDKDDSVGCQTDNKKDSSGEDDVKFSGRVLVAEDSMANQTLIRLLLEKMGFVVTIAADGIEALGAVNQQYFDLIFMDMQMPNMNGYEAAEKMRNTGIHTPIIAMTANISREDERQCINAGCDDFVPKPIDRTQLYSVIKKQLSVTSEN